MEFRGKCNLIDKIVVSDPSYKDDVWCRYERNNINGKDWKVCGFVNDCTDEYEDLTVHGVDFVIALSSPDEHIEVHEDGSFAHNVNTKVSEFTIGMDTACVGFGVNKNADLIKSARDEWQPDCCLKTLTDGEFGTVFEGSHNGEVKFIVLSGFLDEDTGYSVKDVFNYLVASLDIELERGFSIDELIAEAFKKKQEQSPGLSDEKVKNMWENIFNQLKTDKDDIDLS